MANSTIRAYWRISKETAIRNADIGLLVKDTDRALDGVLQTASDVQGYLISSRTWSQDHHGINYRHATLTGGIPADQFENTLRRLRGLAVRVADKSESGQDVTEQYVDLQAQLTNLETTRARIKAFLAQAQTVDEALRVNQQLSAVEAQIEQIKGQMNYLSSRAAFSTIAINLAPQLPKTIATPTPTVTATPSQVWGRGTRAIPSGKRRPRSSRFTGWRRSSSSGCSWSWFRSWDRLLS